MGYRLPMALPNKVTEATIKLLSITDKYISSSNRPISLWNGDTNISTKFLATWLDTVIKNIISMDQSGFIRGSHSFINIRKLLLITPSSASSLTPKVVVSLDAEMVLDRVDLPYLLEDEKSGIQSFLICKWPATIYISQILCCLPLTLWTCFRFLVFFFTILI